MRMSLVLNEPTSTSCITQKAEKRNNFHQNADLAIVRRLLYDLRCHPERGANEGALLVESVGQLTCHSEVCQFHITLFRQQHIGSWKKEVMLDHVLQVVITIILLLLLLLISISLLLLLSVLLLSLLSKSKSFSCTIG